jgi:hypothetical protein
MEVLGAIAALVPLVVALIEAWTKGQPARRRAQLEADYDGDVLELDKALRKGKAGTLTQLFELERRAVRKRLPGGLQRTEPDGNPRGPDGA